MAICSTSLYFYSMLNKPVSSALRIFDCLLGILNKLWLQTLKSHLGYCCYSGHMRSSLNTRKHSFKTTFFTEDDSTSRSSQSFVSSSCDWVSISERRIHDFCSNKPCYMCHINMLMNIVFFTDLTYSFIINISWI